MVKASERLAQRNELLTIIAQIDADLKKWVGVRSFRVAQQARNALVQRGVLVRELNDLGFSAPDLDEGVTRGKAATSGCAAGCGRSGDPVGGGSVARRRIGPPAKSAG